MEDDMCCAIGFLDPCRLAGCIGIAASKVWLGDVWALEVARNPMFSRTKWFPASMFGSLSVRRVRLALGRVLYNAGVQIEL